MNSVLIFATSYVAHTQAYRIFELWTKVTRHLNPDCDILIIDSASPISLLPACEPNRIEYFTFPDNIGHLNITGVDGWGRAFTKGIEIAIERGYEYFSNLDADLIFTKPVMPIIDRMRKAAVKVACPMDVTYQFLETAVSFYETAYMRESRFIERYNWQEPIRSIVPERRCEVLFGDDLFTLPLRGFRNEMNQVTHQNIMTGFPMGLDYLTHAKDFSLFGRLLEKNGVKL